MNDYYVHLYSLYNYHSDWMVQSLEAKAENRKKVMEIIDSRYCKGIVRNITVELLEDGR